MPKHLEEALKRRAAQHGFERGSDRYNRYVYGTLEMIEKNRKPKPKEEHDGEQPEHGR